MISSQKLNTATVSKETDTILDDIHNPKSHKRLKVDMTSKIWSTKYHPEGYKNNDVQFN